MKRTISERLLGIVLCLALLLSILPAQALRALAADDEGGAAGYFSTIADPTTLTRPELIYGNNTLHAGKITVGKSVSNTGITVNGQNITLDGLNNFLVTISQSAQAMGLTSQSSVPVDVVFVIDTSGSMDDNGRAETLVDAANAAIKTLMETNAQNRVAVVAFSSEGYGGGTSGNAAASVLSPLQHYTGDAATNHLRWVNQSGTVSSRGSYIAGRGISVRDGRVVNNYRHGKNGGTNIQAGIVAGAKILTSVTDTTWTNPETNESINRIPFLIVISDGQPTYVYDDSKWYNPTTSGYNAAEQVGSGSGAYEGNGFVAALTAAYYKGLITEHYYGNRTSEQNRAYVYTMGVEIESLTDDSLKLAQITLDPATYAVAGGDYYTYGNTWNSHAYNRNTTNGWQSYWNKFLAGERFDVRVDSGTYYTFTANAIAAGSKYVHGIGYTGGLAYNDEYFAADDVSEMESLFSRMVATIQEKAISSPTKVTTGDHNFDGYVNFYDPIGAYMEVKDMKGILAAGQFYQGGIFAQKLSNYGTNNGDPEFDAVLRNVFKTRMGLSSANGQFVDEAALDAFIDDLLTQARDSANQANYTDADNYDNSIVWWGNAYNSGEEDEAVQVIGFADNDSIAYIQEQAAANAIPAGADYVCRSYFFCGKSNDPSDYSYMYFIVRVQRELSWPYRQTVVISAPASLLSVEKVVIHETEDENGNPVYTASVQHQEPARVVYEVGLWENINEENVSYIVSGDYKNAVVNGTGSVNYDPATDTYHFFTNEWDRSQSPDSHHRAMARATFDAASDNAFYTYQKDTLIVDANGNPVTRDPRGTTAYYVREYYEWADDGNQNGDYTAVKKTALIPVAIPEDAVLLNNGGGWYIPKGAYTSATLVVNGDDTMKDDPATSAVADGNLTGTSFIVAHPHRTGDADNSHYTVFLGNNGKLSLKANPYVPEKTSSINLPADAVTIVDHEGQTVQVGDVLTYTIAVKNIMSQPLDITVTDYIPAGTAFVPGSAGSGTAPTGHTADPSIAPNSNNVLTWVLEDVPAGETLYVSFRVTVTEAALSLNVVPGGIENTATVQIGKYTTIRTNTTHNAPLGKTVTDVNGVNIDGTHGFKVGDILVYHIHFQNTAVDADGNSVAANVTVTDKLPDGTTFVSADNGGTYDPATGTVTWQFNSMAPKSGKVVSFQVKIHAGAKINETGIQPETGEIYLPNTATVMINQQPLTTNTTQNWADVGDMVISKLVAQGGDQTKTFTMVLTESSGLLNGHYAVSGGDATAVEFVGGKATVSIKHGQTLTIHGLPAGVILTVAEDVSALPGWTPTYNTQTITITKGAATAISSVSVTNTYTLQPLTVTVQGTKKISGTAFAGTMTFGFVAVPHASNPEMGDPLSGEVVVTGTGEFHFNLSPKVFTKPGVYKYTVYEINGGVQGVTYDGTQHVLEINVLDNGDGTMRAEAKLNNAAFDLEDDAVTFTNDYTPKSTHLQLTADKALTGRHLQAGEFSFLLTDGTNSYRGVLDAAGNILFETIAFTKAGVYTYTLSEVIPDVKAEGMTYDTRTYTVVVTVTDNAGQLVTAVTIDGEPITVVGGIADTGVLFENTFVPQDVSLTLTARKALMVYNTTTGQYVETAPEAGAFRFWIVEKANPENVVAAGTNDATGKIVFSSIYFSAEVLADVTADAQGNKSKTFTYVIYEVVADVSKDPNMLYDATSREIQVTLTHTADGKLIAAVNGDTDGYVDLSGSVVFTNYGNPSSISVAPAGVKTTTGENLPAGLSFSFKVIPVGGTMDAATGTSAATQGGTNGETTVITFTSMVYTSEHLGNAVSRTFRYWIMESNVDAGDNGVTYDTTRYLYQVTLSRDSYGRLIATEQYFKLRDGGNAENADDYTVEVTNVGISFVNEYHAETYINLEANKELIGRESGLEAGEFDFVLQRLDARGKIVSGSKISGTNAADGVIRFATLNYSSAMLDEAYRHADGAFYFSYVMREIRPADEAVPGVTYDTAMYVVTIKITQTVDGLTAELANVSAATYDAAADTYRPSNAVTVFTAAGNTGVTFTNTYQTVEGDVVRYQIRKILNGRDLRAGEFEFGVFVNGQLHEVAVNDENGIIDFVKIIPATASKYVGTYQVTIRELSGNLTGVTYSNQEFTLYIKITDNGTGKLEATLHLTENGEALPEDANGMVDLTDVFQFVNSYKAHDVTFTPEATKNLTGRDLIAGEFSFEAQLVRQNGNQVTNGAVYNGVNTADGRIVFSTITFTEVGTYIYRLREVGGSIDNITYDTASYYLKVQVTDDGHGHLRTSVAYYAEEACTTPVSAVEFRNIHTPDNVAVQLQGNKQLIGRDLRNNEFSFLVHKDTATGPVVATGSNNAQGNIIFSVFEINAADMGGQTQKTFTFVIVESNNMMPGVTYAEPVTVTVTVTDVNGVLVAEVNYPDQESAKFVNYYAPDATQLPLVAYKTLNGKNLAEGEFSFQLKDAQGNVLQTVTNDAGGVIRFENLTFTVADMVDADGNKVMHKTFVYTVSEVGGTQTGMVYDTTVFTVTVTVTDDGMGNLNAVATYSDGQNSVENIQFVNNYTPSAIEVELEGSKTIVDANGMQLTDSKYSLAGFEFQVYDAAGNLITTAVSDTNGKILLTGLRFTAAGEYRFTVQEKTTDRAGYTTDPTVWCVHITIGYNADTGMLYQSGQYIHIAPETHEDVPAQTEDALEFVNVYDPADVTLILKALKELDGRVLRENEFTFVMVDKATGLIAAQSRNHANGEINFRLTYTQAGVYNYTIYEQIPTDGSQLGGVTYSTQTYDVTVTVVDDGSGALKIQVGEITTSGTANMNLKDTVVFNNTYTPDSIQAALEAQKILEGKPLTENAFTFELKDAQGNVIQTATNDVWGWIGFENLTFTASDMVDADGNKVMEKTFYFTISEKCEQLGGMQYDSTVYTVAITVKDNGQGKLYVAQKVYTDATGAVIEIPLFTNVYTPGSVDAAIELQKHLTGRPMGADEFTFQLKDAQGNVLQTVTNNASGWIRFENLTFTASDMVDADGNKVMEKTFVYTVSEEGGQLGGVTYDTTVFTVTITVVDDGEGNLEVQELIYTDAEGNPVQNPGFTNVYTPASVEAVIEAQKILTGKNLVGGEFTFQLKDAQGNVIATATNDANGNIVFENLTFTASDMVDADGNKVMEKTFVYTVFEEGGQMGGVAYDTAVYTVTVTVTDDGQGNLQVSSLTYTDADGDAVQIPVFTNVYTPGSVSYVPQVTKILEGAQMRTFRFILASEGITLQTKENDAQGLVTFDALSFTQAGTYTYTIAELQDPAMDDILWDTNIYTLTIQVVDNGEGQLEIGQVTVTSTNGRTDLVFRNVLATEDRVEKDVFHVHEPTVSIDGQLVQVGDVLLYCITYHNSNDAAADVTITDRIPQHTVFVSADNGGAYADGMLTWNVHLQAGESITVSFQVKVLDNGVTITNQASALEGAVQLDTNIVSNYTPEPLPDTGDSSGIQMAFGAMCFGIVGMVTTLAILMFGKKKSEFFR